jgi:hypothetical protein
MLFAQSQDELTNEVIKAQKKRIVGANMQLTEEEQKYFGPRCRCFAVSARL